MSHHNLPDDDASYEGQANQNGSHTGSTEQNLFQSLATYHQSNQTGIASAYGASSGLSDADLSSFLHGQNYGSGLTYGSNMGASDASAQYGSPQGNWQYSQYQTTPSGSIPSSSQYLASAAVAQMQQPHAQSQDHGQQLLDQIGRAGAGGMTQSFASTTLAATSTPTPQKTPTQPARQQRSRAVKALGPIVGASPSSSDNATPGGAQTPMDIDGKAKPGRPVLDKIPTKSRSDFRPKTSIPVDIMPEEFARQCINSAIASRLQPVALHSGEYQMLREHINHVHVTTYLNVRNAILRLWHRNTLVSVTREEAAGCAKDYKFFDVAEVAYDWLVRSGYINFGMCEVPNEIVGWPYSREKEFTRQVIVVIGAGVAGLGAARQIESLLMQYGDKWGVKAIPKVVVLEARGRIGGRIYSHPLSGEPSPTFPYDKQCTADVGAQIITGFENGNPLNVLVKGQLALHYSNINDQSILYEENSGVVEKERDLLVESLYNDALDRAAVFKAKQLAPKTAEGDKELIESGREPTSEGGALISVVEENEVTDLPPMPKTPPPRRAVKDRVAGASTDGDTPMSDAGVEESFSANVNKFTGKPSTATGSSAKIPVGEQLVKLGWTLQPGADPHGTINLDKGVPLNRPTLGQTMTSIVEQYRNFVALTPEDLKLLNWHYANMEYANAAKLNDLSLASWDQDDGNEFRGAHAMIVGGYSQVPKGLMTLPTKLEVRNRYVVKRIHYNPSATPDYLNPDVEIPKAVVELNNGQAINADKVIVTVPLGVLKSGDLEFNPPLPSWKTNAIKKIGFGLLNKVVLSYDAPFWDVEKHMVGLLRDPVGDPNKLTSYESRRGRFYMFWNIMEAAGRPVLSALMAGDAAEQAENDSDETIISEATTVLQNMYPNETVPSPREYVITRWRKDPYAQGSYSNMAPGSTPEDYVSMAKPVGSQLFFAGEGTCVSHPATVHGAYISGLRVASEVMESYMGPITVPAPLIPPKSRYDGPTNAAVAGVKRKAEVSSIEKARDLREARLEQYEKDLEEALFAKLGERPSKPGRSGANPFLLYQKDKWFICKAQCDESRQKATGNADAKATRNEVRAALGQMWRDASDEEKAPYLSTTSANKESNAAAAEDFKNRLQEWDNLAEAFKTEYREKNPSVASSEEADAAKEAEIEHAEIKRTRKLNGYFDDDSDDDYRRLKMEKETDFLPARHDNRTGRKRSASDSPRTRNRTRKPFQSAPTPLSQSTQADASGSDAFGSGGGEAITAMIDRLLAAADGADKPVDSTASQEPADDDFEDYVETQDNDDGEGGSDGTYF